MEPSFLHVCKTSDVEAPPPPAASVLDSTTVRDAVMGIWGVTRMAQSFPKGFAKVRSLEMLCRYGLQVWSRKRKTPVNVPEMVAQWKACIVVLCTAHDKDAIDRAEFKMDELLTPLLSAPVAQLREFYGALLDALRSDPQVPFFIWAIFSAYGKAVVDVSKDKEASRKLRRRLAGQIADMAEERIDRKDVVAALTGALMWRDPETLENIKSDLEEGAKPRLKGRESCLFMVTKRKGREHMVML